MLLQSVHTPPTREHASGAWAINYVPHGDYGQRITRNLDTLHIISYFIDHSTNMTDTRERLIDTARQLFWDNGYTNTGIAQILKQADAGSGSLYYFFPTKEDLLLAVLDWYKRMLGTMVVEPVCQRVSDPIERIFGILDGYRQQLLATEFRSGCPIGNLALEVCNSHPAARQLVADNFTGWIVEVRKCLDAAA